MSFTATITANVTDFEKGVQQAQKSIDGLEKSVSSSLSKIGDKFTNIGQKMSIASAAIVAAGAASFKMAADFQDAMGATDQVFKENAKVVQDWASNLPSMYGIAKKEALEYANIMGSMLVNIGGLTQDQAAKQSASLIQLAGDLTAMFGGTTQDAVRALTGALKGNNTMLDNYGMAVNDTLVKQRAFELGLIGQGEELSLVAKQAATLSLIYEQSGAAQGQAAREADGASGAMRALGVEFKNLSTELGEVLLPILTPFVAKLRDFTASLRDLSPEALQTGVIIAGLVAVIGPLLLIIGKFIAILPALKVGITALAGPIGLVVAGVAALTIGTISLINHLNRVTTSAGAFADINEKVISSISKELVQLDKLLLVAKNDKESKDNRLDAIKKLNLISPEYLSNLTLENINTKAAKTSVEQYTTALRENAREKAIGLKLGQLEADLLDREAKLLEINEKFKRKEDTALNRSAKLDAMIGPLKDIILIEKQIALYKQLSKAKGQSVAESPTEDPYITGLLAQIEALKASLKASLEAASKEGTTLKELGIFDKLVGDGSDLNDIVARTAVQIQLMTARLEGLRSGTIQVANVKAEIEKTKTAVDDLNTAFTTLTGLSPDLATSTPEGGKTLQDVLKTPKIDTTNIKIAGDQILDDINTFKKNLFDGLVDLSNIAAQGVGAFAATIGDAFGSGNFKGLGKGLISALGGLASQMGSMLIGLGVAALKLKVLIANPLTAIAAGAALVALGAAASASASKMVQSTTSGGGGYSSGGASGSYQNTSSVGASDYRGQYQDDYVVEFKIGSNELVGVLDMANQRRNRL